MTNDSIIVNNKYFYNLHTSEKYEYITVIYSKYNYNIYLSVLFDASCTILTSTTATKLNKIKQDCVVNFLTLFCISVYLICNFCYTFL